MNPRRCTLSCDNLGVLCSGGEGTFMGMEARYHALPEDCHVLTEVCHEARFAKYLQFLDYYLNDPEFRLDSVLTDSKEDPEETAFVVAVQSLKVARPGVRLVSVPLTSKLPCLLSFLKLSYIASSEVA